MDPETRSPKFLNPADLVTSTKALNQKLQTLNAKFLLQTSERGFRVKQRTTPLSSGITMAKLAGCNATIRDLNVNPQHMGSCQNYGPFLGTLNNRCHIIKV